MVIEHSNTNAPADGFEVDLSQEHLEPMLQENLDRFVPVSYTHLTLPTT